MSEDRVIHVVVVDDHPMVRSGLCAFLLAYDDLKPAGEAGSGEEAVELCKKLRPDVVLMDIMMPGMGGIAAISAVRECSPATRVIALTSFTEHEHVQGALKAGAISYLMKNVSAEDLICAIRDAMSDRPHLSPEATRALVHNAAKPPVPGKNLTETERSVLKLMVEGLNNKEIAQRLTVSTSTVKFHVSNILGKLEAGGRTEAVATAIKHGIIKNL